MVRAELLRPLARGGPVAEFAAGLRLSLRGAALTLSRPRLLALVVLPALLNLAVFAILVHAIVTRRDLLTPDFAEPWPFGLDWMREGSAAVLEWLGIGLALVTAAIATWLLYPVVAAPFLEFLSEAVESLVFDHADDRPIGPRYVWEAWVLPVFQALGVALVQAAIAAAMLLLSFTGVLSPLLFLGGVWLLAVTLCDVAIARKSYPVAERFRRVNRRMPAWLGVALPAFFVPFLLPLGVAGATLLDLRERALEG